MKTKLYFSLIALCMLSFVGCKNDSEEITNPEKSAQEEGVYVSPEDLNWQIGHTDKNNYTEKNT